MARTARRILGSLLLAVSMPQLATALIGCGPGATVQLCWDGGCCNIVEFGTCTAGAMNLTLAQAPQCNNVLSNGMSLSASGPAGVMEVCAALSMELKWYGWLSSTQEGTQQLITAYCQPATLPCATTLICNSNEGCCTVSGYGSCTTIDRSYVTTLSIAPGDACSNGPYAVALSTSTPYNNSTTCALPVGANLWTTWYNLPTIGWQDYMNATCV